MKDQPPQIDTLYLAFDRHLNKITLDDTTNNIMNMINADQGANNSTMVNIPSDLIGSGTGTGMTSFSSGGIESGKQAWGDGTAGFFFGIDSADGVAKLNIGDGTHYIKWNGTTLSVVGGFSVSQIDIPDITTAHSFHTDGNGNSWWGATTLAGATGSILNTGAGTFSNMTITGGSIATTTLNPGVMAWTSDIVFTSVSATQVNWTTGHIRSQAGVTYTISPAGNTGTMSALTYIYLDTTVGTSLSTTTNYATATGDNKILIAMAQNNTVGASVIPMGSGQPVIDGSQITALSVTASNIAAYTITANKLTISQLSAITADMGSINAGSILIGGANYIPSYPLPGSLGQGLVSYYKLDYDSSDSLGGNNGTDTAISYATAGKIGNCATFNGTNSSIFLGALSAFNNASFSISAWVKIDHTQTDWSAIFNNLSGDGTGATGYDLEVDPAGLLRVILGNHAGTYLDSQIGNIPYDNNFHHVVLTFNKPTVCCYVDGTIAQTISWNYDLNYTVVPNAVIGVRTGYLKGSLDEIGMWSRALSASEVASLYTSVGGTASISSDGRAIFKSVSVTNYKDYKDASVVFTGSWTDVLHNVRLHGKYKKSNTIGDYFEITFTGTSIGIMVDGGSDAGKLDIYIDTVYQTTIDRYVVPIYREPCYIRTDLTNTSHVMKCVIASTKNAASSDYYITIEGYSLLPNHGIFLESLSLGMYQVGYSITTDANGYGGYTASPPTGHSFVAVVGGALDPAIMYDATLTDPKIAVSRGTVYMYNGAPNTTYTLWITAVTSAY